MKYFFILGNNPTLSIAEIKSVLNIKPADIVFMSEQAAVVDIDDSLDAKLLIDKLGGTIKIGSIKYQVSSIKHSELLSKLNLLSSNNKINFGFSYYGSGKFDEKDLAMDIKNKLKSQGVSSRWVTSREKQLSSVVVEQNKLIGEYGAEVVIIKDKNNYYIGKTLAVQPFKELSKRDYGRPGRDDYSGMLPPKLAKIMVNLSKAKIKNKILDPFCGSGTILTEAAVMGFRNTIGTDKSERAIADTKKNFQFTISNFQTIFNEKIFNNAAKAFQCDVRNLAQKVKPNSIDAIITETYLGPSRMKQGEKEIRAVIKELESLYAQAFKQFAKVLKSKGKVVIAWPIFKTPKATISLSSKFINEDFRIINVLENFKNNNIKLTNRNTIVYGRPGQKVWREIFVLEKK